MNKFFFTLQADLYRSVRSVNFLISIMVILLVMFISSGGFISPTTDALDLLGHGLTGSGSSIFILCIAPILPYGMSFALDMEERSTNFWMIRTGVKTYAISKYISAMIAGFLSVSLSIIIFTFGMTLFFPLLTTVNTGDSYALLLEQNKPILYVLLIAVHYGLSAVLFAGGAITVSAFISNRFTVVIAPLVFYFVLIRLTDLTSLPLFLRVSHLVQGIYPDVSPLASFLYKLLPVIGISGVLLYITVKQIQRRMRTL